MLMRKIGLAFWGITILLVGSSCSSRTSKPDTGSIFDQLQNMSLPVSNVSFEDDLLVVKMAYGFEKNLPTYPRYNSDVSTIALTTCDFIEYPLKVEFADGVYALLEEDLHDDLCRGQITADDFPSHFNYVFSDGPP